MEFKEPSHATFSFLEESESKNIIYKNKKSNIIKNLILTIRKDKNEEKKEQEKKERNKSINISRFLRPYYKKYSYMDYPFYKTYNKEKNNERDNNEYEL